MKNRIWIGLLAAIALATPLAHAQDQGMGDMMFTAGTVTTDTAGQEWAWLQWMATDSTMLKDRPMEIYRASGVIGSGNPFFLKGLARQVTDPRSIALLLTHGAALGENITNLTASVDSLYDGAQPSGDLALAENLPERLAALISGSQDDPELYQNLVFIGRAHPSVAMAIGQGFACRVPTIGNSTFEIRTLNTGEVIGRLELQGGNPLVLPAPGPIARVPDTTPKGNLNIRLRWDISDDLKRISLLQFGYNLYRITQPFAESKGYNTTPPSNTIIADLVLDSQDVVKVNRAPILVDPATATTNTWFAVDDNDGLSGGTPFVDGENYYYFVSALDLLGRDGDLSDGFMTFPCDRFAPSVPHQVRTRTINDFIGGVHTQWIEVSWAHDTNDTDTSRYYVYRHTGIADMQSNAVSAVANRVAGPPIVPGPADTRVYYEDHTLSSNDWSQTYWYTVRAEDNASCGNNLSGNSAPAFGLLRDWEGPPPATGVVITIQGEVPEATFDHQVAPVVLPAPSNVQLACKLPSTTLPITWAQFGWHWGNYQGAGSETNIIKSARIHFPDGTDEVSKDYFLDIAGNPNESVVAYFCRVGSSTGKISEWAYTADEKPDGPTTRYEFRGDISVAAIPIPADDPGPTPGPHFWGTGVTITFPTLTIPAVTGAETVRVYRRVDGGTRTLIHQGEMDEVLGALITDYTGGSVNGGTICYYYQLFDEHGNAGPMVFIHCFEVAPRVDPPTPILDGINSTGTAIASPGLTLEWFCTTPGVERFEVAVALDETGPVSTFGTSGYTIQSTNQLTVVVGGVTNALDFGIYRTGRIGTTFGSADSPEFFLNSLVGLDRDYTVMVRAIGVAGITGPWSNIETFRWSTVPTAGPDVPWPARGMPKVQTELFHSDLDAVFLGSNYVHLEGAERVGIRIGEFSPNIGVEKEKFHSGQIFDLTPPMGHLYTNVAIAVGQTVMPCVLYRYQLANSLYPTVSGDVAQVSPLMEEIAYGTNAVSVTVYDPFIGITRKDSNNWEVYLIDTQPVVRGAKYQYLLMRFDEETKELDRIIPAGTVTIP